MKEPFDKIVKNKIEDFIDTNKESYNANHWQMLLDKKKASKKRGIIYLRWAAVLVLFLLAGGVAKMLYKGETPLPLPKEQPVIVDSENDTLQNKKIIEKEKQISSVEENVVEKEVETKNSKNKKQPKNHHLLSTSKIEPKIHIKKEKNTENIEEENSIAIKNTKEKFSKKNKEKEGEKTIKKSLSDSLLIAQNRIKKTDFEKQIKEESISEKPKVKKEKRTLTLGINASSMLSYTAKLENPNLGYSGGISVEVPLNKSFDLQAEVVYSSHTMDYLNSSGESGLYSDFSSSRKVLTSKVDMSFREGTVTMIEIPVSVKYHFKIQKQKWFVSAGFSATSVLKEKINSNYDVSERIVSAKKYDVEELGFGKNKIVYEYINYEQKVSTQNAINNFYPIGSLQLSFGSEFHIGSRQSMVIEPYYKHFVRPITIRKTTFSNVGIRLQYRFNFKK